MADLVKLNYYLVAELDQATVPTLRSIRDRLRSSGVKHQGDIAGDPATATGAACTFVTYFKRFWYCTNRDFAVRALDIRIRL